MIYELLEKFGKVYKEQGDKLILDNYVLKEGLYVKLNDEGHIDYYVCKKKNKEIVFSDLNGHIQSSEESWFKQRDYISVYLNSNKSFYDKKIHNINYLTFFVKLESFISSDPKKILNENVIKEHFNALKYYKKFTKKQEIEILEKYRDYLDDENRLKDVKKKYEVLYDKLPEIIEKAKELQIKNYIKIFFDEPVEKYKLESEIYYSIKIFNDIQYSIRIDESIFGLSNSNMGLNSKKPFLENKTRKNSIPFYVTKENALLLKKFFDWLKVQPHNEYYPLDKNNENENFFILKQSKNDEAEIISYEYIPVKIKKLKKNFLLRNHLLIRHDNNLIDDETIIYLNQLEDKVDELFYNGQLKNNYFGDVYNKLNNSFSNLIYITRDAMANYFKKYSDNGFYSVIKKFGILFIIEHIRKNNLRKGALALNLKLSILEYKGEDIMNISEMQKTLLEKLEKGKYEMLTKDEFFYLTGQIARYLIEQSQARDKKGDMIEPYLRANNSIKLKKVLEMEYFKYKHAISLNFYRFNNAFSLVMAFEQNLKLNNNLDSFLVGALSDNIFYMMREKE